jgi:hypothetical protein
LSFFVTAAAQSEFQPGVRYPGPEAKGKASPGVLAPSATCAECHVPEGEKWRAGFRPHAFDDPFVQAEYQLAWAKAKREKAGEVLPSSCVACHSPIQYLEGSIPKEGEPPAKDDEGISCDFCHSTWGFEGDTPGQFNWVFRKGGNRFGPEIQSALGRPVRFTKSPELCGTCHNEKGPGGQWVKSNYKEWKDGPYSKTGEKGCLDCHKQFKREFVAGMIKDSVQLKMQTDRQIASVGETVMVTVALTNVKGGHSIPGGSAELRQVWLHAEVTDSVGKKYPLVVQPKGFKDEEFTIGSNALAYEDFNELKGGEAKLDLMRDGEGIAQGDRIFRLPMLDREGRMTAFEWNAYAFGTDYRLKPLEMVTEHFLWTVPADFSPGPARLRAVLSYRRAPPSLWKALRLATNDDSTIIIGTDEANVTISSAK